MDETSRKANPESENETAAAHGEANEDTASEMAKLRQQLEEKEAESKENYDRFLRQVAELDNFKKRMARDKGDALRYANEALARDLLPVLDNLERAIEHAKGGGNGKPLLDGIEMVFKGFLEVLNKHGVKQLSALGEIFDPAKHEAIAQIESEQHEPNTVVAEHHKGYYLLDRLLRPALVTVAKTPTTMKKKREGGEVEKVDEDD